MLEHKLVYCSHILERAGELARLCVCLLSCVVCVSVFVYGASVCMCMCMQFYLCTSAYVCVCVSVCACVFACVHMCLGGCGLYQLYEASKFASIYSYEDIYSFMSVLHLYSLYLETRLG